MYDRAILKMHTCFLVSCTYLPCTVFNLTQGQRIYAEHVTITKYNQLSSPLRPNAIQPTWNITKVWGRGIWNHIHPFMTPIQWQLTSCLWHKNWVLLVYSTLYNYLGLVMADMVTNSSCMSFSRYCTALKIVSFTNGIGFCTNNSSQYTIYSPKYPRL